MKNDIDKDNSLLPLCRQDTKKEKEQEAKKLHTTRRHRWPHHHHHQQHEQDQYQKSSQLSRSQRCIRVGHRWEDRDIGELKEWLIPLTVDDLLVAPNNL
jgi:hypothetical protein